MAMFTNQSETYSVHTGTDIFTVFNNYVVGGAQGISYSITRQKAEL